MNLPTNLDRSTWADAALDAYARLTRTIPEDSDTEELVRDLLTDLMHLCDRDGVDFAQELEYARGNYQEEMDEEAEETD